MVRRAAMLVTMKNSELIDQLVLIADGNLDLVKEAISASAEGLEGAADLKKVVDYIVLHRASNRKPEAA
jgi:hypothetical protein